VDILNTLLIMAACLVLEGFFSGSEIGVIGADTMKLRHQAANGSKGAKLALKMLEKPEWLLSTTLVGTNISVVTNTTMGTALMIHLFGEQGSWLAIVLVAPLIWVFGEIVPKSIFQQRADTITPRIIYILRFFSYLFFPVLIVFSVLTRLITKLIGSSDQSPFTLREEIVTMLQMPATEGDIQSDEKDMIRRMFSFSETPVNKVMIPLIDVVAVENGINCGEAMRIATESSHVRLPVYEDRVDRVVGTLYVLELLGEDHSTPIEKYIKPARYIPGSKSIKELLIEMRQNGEALVTVVDEFGGADGIVALEDIMEEIVEDIEDEYDSGHKPQQWIRKMGDKDYIVSARIELDELVEQLDLDIPESIHATLGGLLMSRVHEIPATGSLIQINSIDFTIQRSIPQAIQEIRIRW
jgi:CBS domain containing-hemolysin-like protein